MKRFALVLFMTACSSTPMATSPDATSPVVPDAPTPDAAVDRAGAATATATNNPLCSVLQPFYWEIGDKNSMLVNGSFGIDPTTNAPLTAASKMSIASASKWLYGTYVSQLRTLTADDINFLHFTSGYTNMGSESTTAACPKTDTPDDVNTCLALINSNNNKPYSYQVPANIGRFAYDGGHLENHASQFGGIGDTVVGQLGPKISTALGSTFVYSQPLLAGGVVADANDYATVLRGIMSGALVDTLGTNPVCTLKSATCDAGGSPVPEAWHYSMAHWVEDDPATKGDGAFSSAGAFGFYPWIEAGKQYYGVIAREQSTSNVQEGYASAQCGRLIRRAWDTGVEQTGTLPM